MHFYTGIGIIAISDTRETRIVAVRGEWSAIESHRAVAAVAVGRDDWVILKIVDGNDAGAIIKPRSMPRQSWRVISARVPRTDAWGECREECRGTRGSFSSGFSTESEIRTSWRGKVVLRVRYITDAATVAASLVAVSLNSGGELARISRSSSVK